MPQPVWLSGLGVIPQSERSPVRFLARAQAWVLGQVSGLGAHERQPINVSLSHRYFFPSLSPSLPHTLKINIFLRKQE